MRQTAKGPRHAAALEAMRQARAARRAGELERAWALLEDAHVLGQPYPGPHLWAHWEMLRVGLARLDGREVLGQVLRLGLVLPGTWLARLPSGNTGGANVNPFRPLPIPERLQALIDERP